MFPTFCVPLGVFIVVVVVKWRETWSLSGLVSALKASARPVAIGAGVTALAWVCLFSWAIYTSVYNDHHNLVGRLRALVNEKDALKVGLTKRDEYIKRLENAECPQWKAGTVRPAPAAAPTQELPNISWTQEQTEAADGKPTVTVLFRIDAILNTPAFVAICDRPCKPIFAEAGVMSHRIDITWPSLSNLAGVFFDIPKPMPAATACKLRIASADIIPVKITTFRILKEGEIPLELR